MRLRVSFPLTRLSVLSAITLAWLLASFLVTAPARADSTKTTRREVTKLAEGVYTIRHPDAPDTFPQGNTTVVIGEREALVVDSCYLPSSAREDIAQIRQWTNKPVRYLVNTHWHYDHTMGNVAYRDAFPALAIVAHAETRRQMAGYDAGWFERYPGRTTLFRQMLEKGADNDGKALTEGEKAELRTAIAGGEPVAAEYRALAPRARDLTPTVAFDHEMTVDLGNREVQIRYLGRGNTAGDSVVVLPKEKIVIAGDLLDHPVPYLGGGYPVELAATLRSLALLDAQVIVPGHGDVMRDRAYLTAVIDLVSTVVAQVDAAIHRIGGGPKKLDEVRKAVMAALDLPAYRARFGGTSADDRDFFDDFSLPGLITAAYAELWPR